MSFNPHLRTWITLAFTVTICLSGCSTTGGGLGQTVPPQGRAVSGPCDREQVPTDVAVTDIDASQIVAVQRCQITERLDGKSSSEIFESNDTTQIAELIRALSDPVRNDDSCSDGSNRQLEAFTFKTRDSKYLAPSLRLNECGVPNNEVGSALSSMTFHEVTP